MNRFAKQMSRSNVELRSQRAQTAAAVARMEQETLVNELARKKLGLENELEDLTDFGPEQTTSLRPTHRDFDPKKWVQQVQNTKLELVNVSVELDIAQKTLKEWFVEEVEPDVRNITNKPAAETTDA